MKFFIQTFGCQMNKHDSERIAGLLVDEGHEPASLEDADLIVVNTCAVREHAVNRLVGYVNSLGRAKRRGALIAVGGCVAAAERERLLERSRFIDIVFGPDDIARLPELVERVLGGSPVVETDADASFFASDLPAERQEPHRAWVSITKGCDNFCSYCIVPYVRGRERSRPVERVVEEVRRAVAEGAAEVVLLGQNVNSYGRDLYGQPRFAELLALVAEAGPARVRFATSHPKDFTREIVEVMEAHENVCPQVHLPAQSGSTRVLQSMNRGYSREQYLEKVALIRERLPEAAISTDLIVGFPGETEEDFEATVSLVREVSFDQCFCFIYSPRPMTKAASMDDPTPREVKAERFARLVETARAAALARNERLVGVEVEVLVDGLSKDGAGASGRARDGRVVNLSGMYLAGTFVRAVVVAAGPHHLAGRPLEAGVIEAGAARSARECGA